MSGDTSGNDERTGRSEHSGHTGHGGHDASPTNPAAFWDEFYAGRTRWSGRPNELLVAELPGPAAGRALDLGCGEGGDAIWLAQQGWQVTAADISAAALAVGAEQAALAGVGESISWERHDLDESFPDGTFDLVVSCYMQSPVALGRVDILRGAAAAVAPGGLLVVIGHAGPPSWNPDMNHLALMPSAAEVLADLDLGDGWVVERCTNVDRPSNDPQGHPGTRPDSVVRVRRHA